jgi:hypothetical protein
MLELIGWLIVLIVAIGIAVLIVGLGLSLLMGIGSLTTLGIYHSFRKLFEIRTDSERALEEERRKDAMRARSWQRALVGWHP